MMDDTTPPEARVDLAQPLLAQIAALGDAYDAWVHKSIGPNTAEGLMRPRAAAGDRVAARWPTSLRVFQNAGFEALSHIHWWVIPLVWLPLNAALFLAAVSFAGLGWWAAVGCAVAGLAGWTLLEYVLHRFVFHWQPRTALGRKLHFLAHGIHHLDPWDPTRLVFPPLAGLIIAALIFGAFWLVLPLAVTLATMAGLLTGYVVYDLSHYYTHHVRPKSRWGKYLKAWHLAHHHKFWTRMYGVSSPFWDIVFRTVPPARRAKARR